MERVAAKPFSSARRILRSCLGVGGLEGEIANGSPVASLASPPRHYDGHSKLSVSRCGRVKESVGVEEEKSVGSSCKQVMAASAFVATMS